MFRYAFLALALVSCKSMNSNSSTKNGGNSIVADKWVMTEDLEKDIGGVNCQGGESEIRMALKSVGEVPQAGQVPFPGWDKVMTIDQTNDQNVRLDTCYNESSGEIVLRRIVQRTTENIYILMDIKADAVVEGLADAMMGDSSTLKIINPYKEWFFEQDGVNNRIVIQGFKSGETKLVGVAHETKDGAGWKPFVEPRIAARAVVVGTLEPMFDPFAGTSCGGTVDHLFVEVEKARIEFTLCPEMGTSGGWAADYQEIAIIDNQEFLPADVKGKRVVVTEKEERSHHHNICDSLRLKTANAEYVFTSGPAGVAEDATASVCTKEGEVFIKNPTPGANKPWNMVYQITYGGGQKNGVILEGTSNLQHWGKGNPNKFDPAGGGGGGPGVGGPGIGGPGIGAPGIEDPM